ncbi:TolC family protein [Acidipila sp. 4G-K13]|uniref:TolC family protein n=2 Tax=Paracidobacterium acidisoli TaxID=2303751 RepID=A0A372IRR5_9BACT|nr:TolC family protein [Paracidobacterium acidisoli]MBT9331016.1 TolC family protein [Paracidobacterium acidisoli]
MLLLLPAITGFAQDSSSTVIQPQSPVPIQQPQISSSTYQGSVSTEKATAETLQLSLDEAIQRGLKHNLGLILTGESTQTAKGSELEQLQSLLPTVTAEGKVAVQETDLAAEGLRIPGFPTIIGPYGNTDIRGTLKWSLLDLSSLQNYLASKHDFQSTKLSAEDARDMVVLTVGNAYLTVIADQARIDSDQAQVNTSKVSLDQASANHQAGTAPLLDELRARVDYQTQEQTLITAQNAFDKDKIALARVIGLPLEQKFALTDQAPYAPLDHLDAETAIHQALDNRSDLKAMREEVTAAEHARKAATDERLPAVSFSGDYGDIGINPATSRGTGNASGSIDVPLFEEAKLRGDAKQAQSTLDQKRARLSDLQGQISADVRDSILDIQSAQKQVEVARSNVQLANEALSEAQQRYAAGVSDNLAVSQAQQTVAQANEQYVTSLYSHNIAKLSLARALGIAQRSYRDYVGGK